MHWHRRWQHRIELNAKKSGLCSFGSDKAYVISISLFKQWNWRYLWLNCHFMRLYLPVALWRCFSLRDSNHLLSTYSEICGTEMFLHAVVRPARWSIETVQRGWRRLRVGALFRVSGQQHVRWKHEPGIAAEVRLSPRTARRQLRRMCAFSVAQLFLKLCAVSLSLASIGLVACKKNIVGDNSHQWKIYQPCN